MSRVGEWIKVDSLDKQIGGDHYRSQKIQPFEYTYAIYGIEGLRASVHTKVNKYMTRDKGTPIQDLQKAIHCMEILLDKLQEEAS